MTAIKVVVERIIPSSVRKLRSLLARSESRATPAASKKEAWDFIIFRIRKPLTTCSPQDTKVAGFLAEISWSQSMTSPSSQNRGRDLDMKPMWPPWSTATSRRCGLLAKAG